MRNFLILLRYKVPIEVVEEHTPDHRAYLKTRYEAGDLIMSGPFVPRTAGVLWAQAQDRDRIDSLIANDPFHQRGVADYEVIEFKPVMNAPALNSLFAAQKEA
jgi:uncharacterized protein YciI